MLGFSKLFVIFILIGLAIGYGTGRWQNGVWFIGWFIVIKVVWKFLTGRQKI
ncbi:MAG: hypothetical protein ACTSQA_00940 [Candidatus Heimdallarchaeaceae archaeon]